MDASGRLDTRDHVIDSLHTRFQSATAVDAVEINGRGFVFAGGADDGISVMTLDGQGRLILLATLADTADMTLADVSALEARVIGGKVAIFAASATENGVTQLAFYPGRIGITKSGSGRLTGGEDNDIIIGMGASSALAGAGGDDILIGREGEVAMHGGDGSDIFIPTYAARQVTIHDYDPRRDTLDLSELAFIRSIAQMKIIPTAGGAALQAGTVRIEIQTSDGKALPASHFTDSMFPLAHYVNDIDYGSLVTPVTPISDPPGTPLSPGGGPGRYSGPTPLPPPPSRKNPVLGTGGDDRIRMPDRGGATDGLRGNDDLLGGHGPDLLIGNNGRDTLSGGKGSDEIYGGAADDLIKGGGHHDRLSGHGSNDTIYGGSGDDRIWGYVGKDVLHGETGNDVILGGPGADSIYGGDGDDLVYGEGGWDRIEGGSGHDKLIGIVGHNVINGGTGNDWIRVWGPGNRISGGDGDDSVTGGMEADHISLDTHDDVARGRMGDDTIFGADGQDRIYGNDGNDALRGEAGNDSLYGGIGDDTVLGEAGDDIVNGDGGHDSLRGGLGNDTMNGGLGPDRMWGELGRDDMLGGAGPDEVWGLNENDTVRGGLGNDTVVGGDGNDLVDGGFGNDIMSGDAGNDTLMGDHGNDTIDGGEGDDVLIGGERYDQLTGGAGADRFVFSAPRISSRPDVIEDFRSGEDVIDLTALPDDLVWTGSDGLSGTGRPEMALQDIQGGTQLLFDLNGDADPDFRISVMGSPVIPFDLLL
ncbi:calcium-binding protein [Paracoccus aerodenitrificans]|uniref:calcium-binding protein n=1 Tax=Paracoccus aerodenitrificans TaxID=3017781 RepID=UPI003EBD2A5D